jgi:hypothetical protein
VHRLAGPARTFLSRGHQDNTAAEARRKRGSSRRNTAQNCFGERKLITRNRHKQPLRRLITGSAFALLLWQTTAGAANLLHETTLAWDDYIDGVNIRIKDRASASNSFLWLDEARERATTVRNKRILVSPAVPHMPMKVPHGLIHHWIGAAFMPNLAIADALPVVRDYNRYKDFYRPGVIDSKSIDSNADTDRFSMVLVNNAFFKKTALDSDYEASYVHLDEHRLFTVSRTTRIREVSEFGTKGASIFCLKTKERASSGGCSASFASPRGMEACISR